MAVSYVNDSGALNNGSGSSSITTPGSFTLVADDLLVAVLAVNNTANEDVWSSLTVSAGAIGSVTKHINSFDGLLQLVIAYAKVTTGGTGTVTVNMTGSRKAALVVYQVRGQDLTSPIQDSSSASGADAAPASGGVNSNGQDDFLIGGVATDALPTVTADSNYSGTLRTVGSAGGGGASTKVTIATQYDIFNGAGNSYQPTLSGAQNWRAGLVAIKPAATGMTGTGGVSFGFSESASGTEKITGTGGDSFPFSEAGSGVVAVPVTGTGAVSFAFSEAASGTEKFTGTGGASFSFSESATATETFTGTGGTSFAFSEAGTADETMSATGGVAFSFSESATGIMLPSGTGGVAFGYSSAAAGLETIEGTGGDAFGFAIAGTGSFGSSASGSGGVSFAFSEAVDGTVTNPSASGSGGVTFPFAEAAAGTETISGSGGESFTFAESASAAEVFRGTGGTSFNFAEAAAGDETITGTGGPAFAFAESGTGSMASVDSTGSGGLSFGFALAARGSIPVTSGGHAEADEPTTSITYDDELVMLLLSF